MTEKIISVIIPVYNAEKYLDKCLSSVKNQTFSDFEVIMVDDGSTDGSADICRKFVDEDSRFKYFYKENGGGGSARNKGIEKATGNYIAFIDSDDYVDADYFEVLSAPLKEQEWDMIQCGMNIRRKENVNCLSLQKREFSDFKFAEAVLKRDFPIFLFITTTSKLYKRDFLIKSGVTFDEEVHMSEDCLFNTQLLPYINSVKQLDYTGYNYIQDNSTLTKAKITYEKAYQSIKVGNITSGIRNELIKKYQFENNPDVIKGFHTAVCIIYISNAHSIETGGFSKEEKEKLYDFYFSVMNYPVDKAIDDYSGTDRKIIEASVKKDSKTIGRIYKMREIKSKIKFW